MITRIVKMTFQPELIIQFQQLFEERKEKIRNMPGCKYLELLQELKDGNVFFTYSNWDSEVDLEYYRNSELFKDTWQKTKVLFAQKAEAWSMIKRHEL